ncbi:conserved hypothetical protein [Vibrio chagasii]|nr:conserved hypothetical protein [Vibrio chagasii]CAH7274616.1 conserved hypothetical protein [Vibrio chagasii]CAH7304612.1 conserved hypothetical protein [Vibrio chagasii]
MRDIIVTAVLTSVLTIAGSYFVMKTQLTAEQDYWLNRQKLERAELKVNKQIEMLESFNDLVLNFDLQTNNVLMNAAKFKAELHLCKQAALIDAKEFECKASTEIYAPHRNQYLQQAYKLSVLMQMLPLYFSDEVVSHVGAVNKLIADNHRRLEEIMMLESVSDSSQYFQYNMDTPEGYMKVREQVISAMLKEIHALEKQLYVGEK